MLLKEDMTRPPREKLRITRIHDLLLREGLERSYDAVRRYPARWRQKRRRIVADAQAFIPLMFRSGEPISSTDATRTSRSPASQCE
jgi:hypothetical protein